MTLVPVQRVFIGTEAVVAGKLSKYQLRAHCQRIFPDVYACPESGELSVEDRALAAVLWSRGRAVVTGVTASALHGAKWVDASAPIELNYPNNKTPPGIISRAETLFADEVRTRHALPITTLQRTMFDLARRGTLGQAVVRVDALANATGAVNADGVLDLMSRHPNVSGIRRVPKVLDLADAGAQSPRETWLRLLLIEAGFPRPETQIPVLREDGRCYFLDMGWRDVMVAVEYDGEQHRLDRSIYRNDRTRSEYIAEVGWRRIRVVVGDRRAEIVERARRAWVSSQNSAR